MDRRVFFVVLIMGCTSSPAEPGSCEGECIPVVEGWSSVLVAEDGSYCLDPPLATLSRGTRSLLVCAALLAPGSCGTGFVCLPPTPWAVCILQDGQHGCPDSHPDELAAEGMTVCCEAVD